MRGLIRNVVYASTGLLGSSLVGLAVSVVIARSLGVEGFGVYGFAVAYVSLWSVLMDGGNVWLVSREVARRQEQGLLRALFTLKPFLILAAYGGLLLVAWLAGFGPLARQVVLVMGIGAGASACLTLALAIFRGYEEFGTESLHLLSQRVLFGLLTVAALVVHGGVTGVAMASTVSWMVMAIPAFWLLRRRHHIAWCVDFEALGRHGLTLLKSAGSLLLADALAQLHTRNAPIILHLARGPTEVGFYVAARRLIEGLNLFPSALGIVLFPRLVSAWAEGAAHGSDQLRVALRFVGTVALGVLLAGWLWAEEGVAFLFGTAYQPAAGLLRIMLGALVFMMVNSVLNLGLISRGGEVAFATVLSGAAAANVFFNILFVPALGAAAAAWASLVSEVALFVGCLTALRRSARAFLPTAHWMLLLAGAASGLGVLWVVKQVSPPVALVLTFVVEVVGFELMSPVGFREIVQQLVGRREFRPSWEL